MSLGVLGGDVATVWVDPRCFEFAGQVVPELSVNEVLGAVCRFMKMVAGDVEMARHVAFPETVGPDQLLRGQLSGCGQDWYRPVSADKAAVA